MNERRRVRLYDKTIHRLFGRRGTVTDVQEIAPGIRELTLRADPPAGGWQPGHDIELWVGDGVVRHYTACQVTSADSFTVVADLVAAGPGSRWIGAATTGQTAELAASQHRDRRLEPGRAVLLGDTSAIGLLCAIREHRAPDARLVIEAPTSAVEALQHWASGMELIAENQGRGEALQRWLRELPVGNTTWSAYFLAGHAQTIQQLRAALVSGGVHRRAISTRAHWATGKTGL